jgi:hypothetical protein
MASIRKYKKAGEKKCIMSFIFVTRIQLHMNIKKNQRGVLRYLLKLKLLLQKKKKEFWKALKSIHSEIVPNELANRIQERFSLSCT